jgi:hypothetical protein
MPRHTINQGDLADGHGVEGRRHMKKSEPSPDEAEKPVETKAEPGQKEARKDIFGKLRFKRDNSADIFESARR